VFVSWREGDADVRARIESEMGTHPYGGGGAEAFTGEHPSPVRRRLPQPLRVRIGEEGTLR
ncbi:MAG: hypothetical protein ACYS9X_29350, partial [Planctomycetota bacterium]